MVYLAYLSAAFTGGAAVLLAHAAAQARREDRLPAAVVTLLASLVAAMTLVGAW